MTGNRQIILLAGMAMTLVAQSALGAPPAEPSEIAATEQDSGGVKITWKHPGTNVGSFKVERRLKSEEGEKSSEIGSVDGDTKEYTDAKALSGVAYVYGVVACTEGGTAEPECSEAATQKVTTKLAEPMEVEAEAVSETEIRLTWKHAEATRVETVVHRSETSGSDFTAVKTVDEGRLVFSDTGRDKDKRYYYSLQAKIGEVKSSKTPEVHAQTSQIGFFHKPDPDEIPNRYDPETVPRKTTCSLETGTCDPPAVYIPGNDRATIEVHDVPRTAIAVVTDAGERWREAPSLNKSIVFLRRAEAEIAAPSVVGVDIFRRRKLAPSHGGIAAFTSGKVENSLRGMRPTSGKKGNDSECDRFRLAVEQLLRSGAEPPELAAPSIAEACKEKSPGSSVAWPRGSLPVRNSAGTAIVTVYWETATGDIDSYSFSVDLVFQRWWVDIGGFYAFTQLRDQELVTEAVPVAPAAPGAPAPQPMTRVLRMREGDEWESMTGIMSTFFPANYPSFGISFGLADQSDRSQTYLLGLSGRLLGKRSSAVATFTVGCAAVPVRRFPGVTISDTPGMPTTLRTDSPLLEGEVNYEIEPFIGITLGFALDRRSTKAAGSD